MSNITEYVIVNNEDTPTLTQTFCEMLEKNADDYSVIDLLEELLPKELGQKWAALKTTFSSTMQKHLVIRKKGESQLKIKKMHFRVGIKRILFQVNDFRKVN